MKYFSVVLVALAHLIFCGCSMTTGQITKGDVAVDFTTINFFMRKSVDGFTVKTPTFGELQITGQSSEPTPAEAIAWEILQRRYGVPK